MGQSIAELGERRAEAMEDKNKEDAKYDQMQKENKGKKVARINEVKGAQKIRSGVEGEHFCATVFHEVF